MDTEHSELRTTRAVLRSLEMMLRPACLCALAALASSAPVHNLGVVNGRPT
jgi:hypothetical protein